MKSWKKKTNATFGIDEKGLVQVVLLLILGGDGRFMIVTAVRKSDRSFIGAFLPDLFSEMYQFSDISHVPRRMGSRSGLPVPTFPSRCTSPRSSQF